MKSSARSVSSEVPEYNYHLLRSAMERFNTNISGLSENEYEKARSVADRTFLLESRVLSTPEAQNVVIPDERLDEAVGQIASRYDDKDVYLADLRNNGLDEETLRSALYRELMFDAVMNKVSAKTADVSDLDVEIFYEIHKEKFQQPEKRKARHILITINPEFEENSRESALQRITSIEEKLKKNPRRFEIHAKKYSECPTGLQGGLLGEVTSGTLFPELDSYLFTMQEGDISPIIESEMGFHILLCERINRGVTTPLSRARERIQIVLEERQRKTCQKAWLDKLQEDNNG